jgi:hypothetical protein
VRVSRGGSKGRWVHVRLAESLHTRRALYTQRGQVDWADDMPVMRRGRRLPRPAVGAAGGERSPCSTAEAPSGRGMPCVKRRGAILACHPSGSGR